MFCNEQDNFDQDNSHTILEYNFVKFAVRDHEPEATDTNDVSINVNSKFFVGGTST